MPNEHRADPTPPPHHGQGRGGSKKESFSLRVSPALHPPERPSPRRVDMADHGLGRETRERRIVYYYYNTIFDDVLQYFCFRCFSGVPAWRLMYNITVGFSTILYCRPNVTTIGEPI